MIVAKQGQRITDALMRNGTAGQTAAVDDTRLPTNKNRAL